MSRGRRPPGGWRLVVQSAYRRWSGGAPCVPWRARAVEHDVFSCLPLPSAGAHLLSVPLLNVNITYFRESEGEVVENKDQHRREAS